MIFGRHMHSVIKSIYKYKLKKKEPYGRYSDINSDIEKLAIKNAIDDFNKINMRSYSDLPYTFTSTICREQHFRMPLYKYWCNLFNEKPKLHRKQWEFVYICQSLYERGYLKKGISGVGFGVGKEPLTSLFSSFGVEVLASDLEYNSAEKLGWVNTDQHSNYIFDLNERGLCDEDNFKRLVSFRNIDMNKIPKDIHGYDFCWSSCSLEHLGSIAKGIEFIINSLDTLKPGGFAIHTTEFNLSSNENTIDNNDSYVIFRRKDIDVLTELLDKNGHKIEPIDFCSGNDVIERYVDLPPYLEEPHLRLDLNKYTATSIGLLIHKKI